MLNENALLVLRRRYLEKDDQGELLETPQGMFARVAQFLAQAEDRHGSGRRQEMEEKFYEMMMNLEFLPNSPTLMNAGRELGQLAACFVLPIDDSLESIFSMVKETAKIHQTGGGTGFSFSRLRPKNDLVSSTKGRASGAVSFIRVFNAATDVIKQGGTRRGANMAILRVDHPDIEEFVGVKRDQKELTNFNLSVAVTDKFMQAYRSDQDFGLVNPRTRKEVRKIKPRDLFRLIAESAWESGEPGVLFIDQVNRLNPTPQIGEIEATNPCGEQPLLPYESCCLGSINLSLLVKDGAIDWQRLKELTHLAVRFLDNVVELNKYPVPEIEKITRGNRKIGLGVMGFAHMLIRLGLPYDSEQAQNAGEQVMKFIQEESKVASRQLADERGTFPNYQGSVWERQKMPQRNATTTTVAPTGTLSIIAGTSSGIEPIYEVNYSRVLFGDVRVEVTDPLYQEYAEKGRVNDETRLLFKTAFAVKPSDHLRIQAVFQKHVDNAVSKTINLPNSATPDDVLQIYLEAHRLGMKGTTVFRDKSREFQVLSCGTQIC